jgi:hypothetical protein
MLCRARRCPLQNTEIFHQINRKICNWEITMEYEVDREIHDWEQINREIRNWKMTMEYEIDSKICDWHLEQTDREIRDWEMN